jgi:hypothetical protein
MTDEAENSLSVVELCISGDNWPKILRDLAQGL